MPEDEDRRRADEPEERAEGRRDPEQWNTDDEESCVKGLLCHNVLTDLHRVWCCDPRVHYADNKNEGQTMDAPHLLIAMKPPMRRPSEMRSRGLVML